MVDRITMKHRMLKTEVGQKVLKALEKCTKNGIPILMMNGRDEREKINKKKERNDK